MESLSQTAIFGLYIPLILTLIWLYVKYSGNYREIGQFIDNVTSSVWDHVSCGEGRREEEKGRKR